jgi:formylglycine-generating enzyme
VSGCCVPGRDGATGRPEVGTAPGFAGIDVDGGTFRMGNDGPDANPGDGEGPVRTVDVAPFSLAPTAVTNEQFGRFVDATGYRTDAEVFGWSYVFDLFAADDLRRSAPRLPAAPWWLQVFGATWRHPFGPGSSCDLDHPVVHVSWRDASAYAEWLDCRLPTEAEWEFAARGGLEGCRYPWGDDFAPDGAALANIWEGVFPTSNTAADGWVGTAPVDAFPPNRFGLHNMVGNVWEWCAGGWAPDQADLEVVRGGSYLCHDSYCNRYRVSARTATTADSSTGHTGFRVAGAHSSRAASSVDQKS